MKVRIEFDTEKKGFFAKVYYDNIEAERIRNLFLFIKPEQFPVYYTDIDNELEKIYILGADAYLREKTLEKI